MSRLTIDISAEQHKHLKALAALQGKTIRQYAIERLFPAKPGDDLAWQELTALLRQRIEDGLAGKVSNENMGSIVDEILSEDGRG